MNYLAHAYLSFNRPAVIAGNITSDYIKGKKQYDYPEDIRKGIILHRAIDAFTDEHPVNKEAMNIFRPHYRLYSAAFLDIAYDYFLANDRQHFSDDSLYRFAQEVYDILDNYEALLPEPFRRVLPAMKKYNWLYNYRNEEGIENSFHGLTHRARYIAESDTAFILFQKNIESLRKAYATFFPQLHQFAFTTLQSL